MSIIKFSDQTRIIKLNLTVTVLTLDLKAKIFENLTL